jgi:hypothetical protein
MGEMSKLGWVIIHHRQNPLESDSLKHPSYMVYTQSLEAFPLYSGRLDHKCVMAQSSYIISSVTSIV